MCHLPNASRSWNEVRAWNCWESAVSNDLGMPLGLLHMTSADCCGSCCRARGLLQDMRKVM